MIDTQVVHATPASGTFVQHPLPSSPRGDWRQSIISHLTALMGPTILHAPSPQDSSILNLFVCIGGIYVCYLSYGIFQENMYVNCSVSFSLST